MIKEKKLKIGNTEIHICYVKNFGFVQYTDKGKKVLLRHNCQNLDQLEYYAVTELKKLVPAGRKTSASAQPRSGQKPRSAKKGAAAPARSRAAKA